ncbi:MULTISPECIES: TonB-dependent receptor [unclassified Sphingomonas]|uniref:TonB-dependent receptor n=2 Tax=Pseudomonadota TaxID=1224 RepID=UPI0010F9A570|nr:MULTISPECIES: TonB-dependent receptor [unclassified Sphingomonas]
MITPQPKDFEAFEDRAPIREALPYVVGLLLLGALAWFVYSQITAVRGVRVNEDSRSVVDVVPLPPPPPPPPPPELKEKPPEPTEQPQPSPAEAPKTPQQQPQAAPVTIAAPAQAGTDSFGLAAGNGGGIGAPGSGGTCLGTNCGAKPAAGGGMGEGLYRRYLSSALEDRVRADERLSRLVFSADLSLTVTTDGRVTGVRLLEVRGGNDEEGMKRLAALLAGIRGLNAPPQSMAFPQRITVRGRRGI